MKHFKRRPKATSTVKDIPNPLANLILAPDENYRDTLWHLRNTLTPASRRFSKLIHAPVIEPLLDLLECTVLRASVALGASLTTLVAGTAIYVIDSHYGYPQPTSIILLLLVVGGIIGLLCEWIYKLTRS